MTIDLSAVTFDNDFFSIETPDGNTLTLNVINESLTAEDKAQDINLINVQLTTYEVNEDTGENEVSGFHVLTSVIGMEDAYTKINTLYPEYKGLSLNKDNMKYCTLEYFE